MSYEELELVLHPMLQPHWGEFVYWGSQVALLLVAGAAAVCGYHQLRTIEMQRRATFLLELDRRFDDAPMAEARILWRSLMERAHLTVSQQFPRSNDGDRMAKVREEFGNLLARMRSEEEENYSKLIRILGFFETVGLMVKHAYVPLEDIEKLFRGPIIDMGHCFGPHIAQRQKEAGVPDGLYEHALYLSATVAKRQTQKNQ